MLKVWHTSIIHLKTHNIKFLYWTSLNYVFSYSHWIQQDYCHGCLPPHQHPLVPCKFQIYPHAKRKTVFLVRVHELTFTLFCNSFSILSINLIVFFNQSVMASYTNTEKYLTALIVQVD